MYEAKNFEQLIGMQGFSDNLLNTHFGLYQGYVKNTNTFSEKLIMLELGTPEYAELNRRFGWEFDGMRLHELYFANLSKDSSAFNEDGKLANKINLEFGSFENWKKDFIATGSSRGIG